MSGRHAGGPGPYPLTWRRGFASCGRTGGKLEEALCAITRKAPPRRGARARRAMSADAFRSYAELIAELRRLCAERRTGTFFIATAANEGGQLGLREGV